VRFGFPYLLLPSILAGWNRMRRGESRDISRGLVFGLVGGLVSVAIFAIVFWLVWQLLDYEELGEYLLRLGLSWLFLTFLSFLTFSSITTSLSTFFLSEDLRLLVPAPVPVRRLFYSRLTKTSTQASWMVVAFIMPVLLAVGLAHCAPTLYYAVLMVTLIPFVIIPSAFGSVLTLLLVNTFPARRARDILMLMGLLFAVCLVMMLRFLQPERLLATESLPDIAGFFATSHSAFTSLLPSFWAGETIFTALRGGVDFLHGSALWTSALAFVILARIAFERYYFRGWSKAQEARKARFTRLVSIEKILGLAPLPRTSRTLLLKDLKVFLRDTTQWSQLLLLLALVVVYLYNFSVLNLDRIPYMSGLVKDAYAFVNLALAAFVLSAVSVRFVFPAVSAEGPAFWLIRSSPVTMRTFLWLKFWIGLVPILLLAEALIVLSNKLLGANPFLSMLSVVAIFFMSFSLVGLAAGMGARYPRFLAENITQVAGSYGGIAFMVVAVLFIVVEILLLAWFSSVYLWHAYHEISIPVWQRSLMGLCALAALVVAFLTFWFPMRRGIEALEDLGRH